MESCKLAMLQDSLSYISSSTCRWKSGTVSPDCLPDML